MSKTDIVSNNNAKIRDLDVDEKGHWYRSGKFNVIELVIISAWAALYTVLIYLLGGPARVLLPTAPLFLIPAMIWGTYLFVLLTMIIRKKGTMIMFAIPLAILFAVSPAQTGFPHWFKAVALLVNNFAAEAALLAFSKKEKWGVLASGATIGIFIYLVFILTVWFFGVIPWLLLSFEFAYIMVPAGIGFGAIAGFAAHLTYNQIKGSGLIMKIRTWG
jgi:hypothetical protein